MNRYSKALRILNPKGQVEDKPLMAVKIVKGEHYSRPVMEKEIREYVKKTFKKSNQYRYRKDNWLETLVEEKQIEFDRKEIEKEIKLRRLYEQMTTKGMMTVMIQGEGETVLDSLEGSVEASYAPLSGPYVSHTDIALVNTAITASGTGSGPTGGFDLGQDYLGFNGDHTELGASRYASLKAIDSTELDTIVITAIRGNDENGGEDPDEEGAELTVWYQIGDAAPAKIGTIIPVGSDDSGLKNWSLGIPQEARNAATKFILWQQSHSGVGFDNYGVTDIKFQRRSPMNVFVSLDSPEAVSFIRTGDGGTTEKDKKKKVQDILDGSDAYLENQFGEDFPGTSPREVGQEEPQPGIGKFEPEVIDYETWKNELEKSDDPEAKKILKGDPKKTFDAFEKEQEAVKTKEIQSLPAESKVSLLNQSSPEDQKVYLSRLGISINSLTNLSNDTFIDFVNKGLDIMPGGTPTTGWDGKFYPRYGNDRELEKSRIVSWEDYKKAKDDPNWYGVETPDVTPPGYRFTFIPGSRPRVISYGKELTPSEASSLSDFDNKIGLAYSKFRGKWRAYKEGHSTIPAGYGGYSREAVAAAKDVSHVDFLSGSAFFGGFCEL